MRLKRAGGGGGEGMGSRSWESEDVSTPCTTFTSPTPGNAIALRAATGMSRTCVPDDAWGTWKDRWVVVLHLVGQGKVHHTSFGGSEERSVAEAGDTRKIFGGRRLPVDSR